MEPSINVALVFVHFSAFEASVHPIAHQEETVLEAVDDDPTCTEGK